MGINDGVGGTKERSRQRIALIYFLVAFGLISRQVAKSEDEDG